MDTRRSGASRFVQITVALALLVGGGAAYWLWPRAAALARGGSGSRGLPARIAALGLGMVFLGWLHVMACGSGDLFATSGARWEQRSDALTRAASSTAM